MFTKILILLIFPLILNAAEFQVDKTKNNQVKFTSTTTIESFDGVTNNIDGYLFYESLSNLQNSKIYFEVDLNTLDTGIGLRNRHMRENYLETDKYKFTYFDAQITKVTYTENNNYSIEATGTIFIHGINKQIVILGNLNQNSDNYTLYSSFNLNLSDFNISIPKVMFLKLNESIKISINVTLKEIKK